MTDEDSEGIPRRHLLGFIGSTGAAVAVSTWWNWENIQTVLDNRDEPSRSRQDQNPNEGSDYNDGSGEGVQDDSGWQNDVPSGCELPDNYADDVEVYIDDLGMDSSRMDEYVENGRVGFEKDGTELGVLVDQDNDGQYDSEASGNFEDLCT